MTKDRKAKVIPSEKDQDAIRIRQDTEVKAVFLEMRQGRRKFGPYASTHEALAVILEEFEEFKTEVFRNNNKRAVEEARQVAATTLRFCIEFG